ncbi:thiolase family protein [Viridibacillus sp. YIM B01967]|uniref:Thiolase family protein n=1 Tax=Viridibacillus soli TaxID=2798301 RepID=A0ABS1H6Y8_9BACL|nr:thiolase family protein [Viridibacillus soli]MBK3495185.1 thiolase family protein [Viridibacillus soli]
MTDVFIILAKRSPIGKLGGILKDIEPEDLLAQVIQNIVSEANLPVKEIDDVIMGNTVGPGGNIARLALLTAGLPVEVPGVTVDRQCGSGLEAINMAARLIQSGAGHIYLAGGVESVSRAPWRMKKPSSLYSNGAPEIYMRSRFSPDTIGDPDMGIAAENVAEKYNISRAEQDAYAYESHQKALATDFSSEIVPITVKLGKEIVTVLEDECPRKTTDVEKLATLKPIFKEKGVVTAGNACPINDGAAVALLMSGEKCRELGLKPVMKFVDAVAAGVDPNYLGIGPVPAVKKLLDRNQLHIETIEYMEFNEAFASQVLASLKCLDIPKSKVNAGGGAIALGHPYGASGAILVTRLLTQIQQKPFKKAIATLGIGGGLGLATLFEGVR